MTMTEVGVTGKYGTRYGTHRWMPHTPHPAATLDRTLSDVIRLLQIWSLSPKTGQEDGDHPTRKIHVHILRQSHCEASFRGNLELPILQKNRGWRSMDSVVSAARLESFDVWAACGH